MAQIIAGGTKPDSGGNVEVITQTQTTTWAQLQGKPYIVVSSKGIYNGLSTIPNDGADFGPDTTLGATALGEYGSPYTKTTGLKEANSYSLQQGTPPIYINGIITLNDNVILGSGVNIFAFGNGAEITSTSNYLSFTNNQIVTQVTLNLDVLIASSNYSVYFMYSSIQGSVYIVTGSSDIRFNNCGFNSSLFYCASVSSGAQSINNLSLIQNTLSSPVNSANPIIGFSSKYSVSGGTATNCQLNNGLQIIANNIRINSGVTYTTALQLPHVDTLSVILGNTWNIDPSYTGTLISYLSLSTPTISANPPVSGTAYQNTNPYDIRLKIPVTYNPTSTAAATLATGISSTSTVTTTTKVSIPAGLTAADGQILTYDMVVPAGWYFELVATNATIGTAEVQAV